MVEKLNELRGGGNSSIRGIHAGDVDFVWIFRGLTDVDDLARRAIPFAANLAPRHVILYKTPAFQPRPGVQLPSSFASPPKFWRGTTGQPNRGDSGRVEER